MYNSFLYNNGAYNSNGVLSVASVMSALIEFNGYALQSANIVTSSLKVDSMPVRNLPVAVRPRTNGSIILNDTHNVKLITISGNIHASTASALELLIDDIKKNIVALEGNLDIMNAAGIAKRYTATLINGDQIFEGREGYHITFCPFVFTFACYIPFGKSMTYNSEGYFANTDLTAYGSLEVLGTVKADAVLVYVINSATAITALTFTNITTGEAITITHAIATNDTIEINSEEKLVYLNGTAIDYDGVFPTLDTDHNEWSTAVTGTSINYDLTIKYLTNYL